MSHIQLVPADLAPFATIDEAKAEAMIEDATAMATRVAPCIAEGDFLHGGVVKAILRGAILRWHESGTGAIQAQTAGPFGMTVDTRQERRGMFWPSEIKALQELCEIDEVSGAYSITPTAACSNHQPWCSLAFGATYCSCGADLTRGEYPLYEV